jgi:8-oxo-dGTP diphosphatase
VADLQEVSKNDVGGFAAYPRRLRDYRGTGALPHHATTVYGFVSGAVEFPSGRVEEGEADEVALQRELWERIGITVAIEQQSAARSHVYETYAVDSVLYRARILPSQSPRPIRVADFRWVAAHEIDQYAFPPADQAAMDELWGIECSKRLPLRLTSEGAKPHV